MDVQLSTNKLEFVFASTNKGKLNEVNEICSVLGLKCINPNNLVNKFGPIPDVIEGINSYQENAFLKAKSFYDWCKLPCIADDTGLEVFSLNNEPGIKSARYAGDNATMTDNKKLLLSKLKYLDNKSAKFTCTLCYVDSNHCSYETAIFSNGEIKGYISDQEFGSAGFGYDGLFIVDNFGKSLSQLKETEFLDTHRYRAFSAINLLLRK
jgi:XTP/dITP diphosphohydrolase